MDVDSALKYIDKQILTDGIKYLKKSVHFNIVQLTYCNGEKSCPFSKADCEYEFLSKDGEKCFFPFAKMFESGMTFLDEMVKVKKGKLEAPAKNAILCLGEFFKTKGKGFWMPFSFLIRLIVLYCITSFRAPVQLKCCKFTVFLLP